MVEPITLSIISLCVMGFIAVNSTGLTLSYVIPWIFKEARAHDRNRKRITRHNAANLLVEVMAEYQSWMKVQPLDHSNYRARTIPLEVTHTAGIAYPNIPDVNFEFQYKDLFIIQAIANAETGDIVGIELVWESKKRDEVENFITSLEKRIALRYAPIS